MFQFKNIKIRNILHVAWFAFSLPGMLALTVIIFSLKNLVVYLIVRWMQIKTIPGHYLTLVRMATIESLNNKCWRGCGEKEKLLHCWRECKLVQPVWKAIWRFLRKLRLEFPCDPAVPLLGIYLDKTVIQKKTRTSRLIAALFTMAKTWNQQKCPWKWKSLYCVQLFATPWTIQSMGFSRPEYWSG